MPKFVQWDPDQKVDEQYTYPTGDAPGALPKGTHILKADSVEGDSFPDGTLGIVMGSHLMGGLALFYCVEWEGALGVPIWINANRTSPL